MPSLIATLGANIAPFLQDLNAAKSHAKEKGEGIGSAFGEELTSKLGGLVGAAALEETFRKTVEYGAHVQDLANRLGISTTAIQQWDYALKQNGGSIDAASKFFEKLAMSRDKALAGKDEMISAFQRLGVSLDQLKGDRLEDIARVIARKFEEGDPQELIGMLRAVGGKGAGEMVATFRAGFDELAKEATIIKPEDIAQLKEADDRWKQLMNEMRTSLAPTIAAVAGFALKTIDIARTLLGAAVGALMGAVETLRDVSAYDLLNPAALAGKLAKGMSAGAIEGVQAVIEANERRDKAAEERQARLAKTHVTNLEDDESKAAKRKEEAEHERIQRIHEQTAEIRRKSDLDGLDATQKRAALEQQIAALKKEYEQSIGFGDASATDLAEQEKAIAEREAELKRAQLAEDKEQEKRDKDLTDFAFKDHRAKYETNSLQQIGGVIGTFSATSEIALLDVQKKSENHLSEILKHLQHEKRGAYPEDVQF
jgi:hypothetical protein